MPDLELLKYLCECSAVSGFEDPVISYVARHLRPYADGVEIDRLGNVIGWLRSPHPEAMTAMVTAHIDEVGFVVRKVEEDGLLRLWRVGGIPEKAMAGQLVAVCPEGHARVPGVIGGKSHHVLSGEEKLSVDQVVDVFVDVGLRCREEVSAAGITVGTPVTWWPFFHHTESRILSKALDNRLAVYALLDLARRLATLPRQVNLCLVGTVHEEWSAWGSVTSATTIKPDMAMVLDVAIASDTPGMEALTEARLDGGPVIGTYMFHPRGPHMGTIPNPKLRKLLIEVAERDHMPYQLGTFYGGVTDSSYLQYSGQGIPVVDVGIPTRYTHYPVEVASLIDTETTIRLVERFLTGLPARVDLSRG